MVILDVTQTKLNRSKCTRINVVIQNKTMTKTAFLVICCSFKLKLMLRTLILHQMYGSLWKWHFNAIDLKGLVNALVQFADNRATSYYIADKAT